MPGERALPDLVARIRVDSTGVDQAISSMIGGFGRANLAITALSASIGLVIVAGKSMAEVAAKHQDAEDSLAQAIAARNAVQKKTAPNLIDVTKASKELRDVQRTLAEFDAAHARGGTSRAPAHRKGGGARREEGEA